MALCLLLVAMPTHAAFRLVCATPSVTTPDGTSHQDRVCWVEDDGWWGSSGGDRGHFADLGGGGGWANPGNATQVRDAGEEDCNERAGNPVVISTGNKIESFLDFSSVGEMGLYLRRTYNHYWAYSGLFGRHWVSNFDYSLVRQDPDTLWLQRPDGRRIKYLWNAANDRYEEDKAAPVAYVLRVQSGPARFEHHSEEQTIEAYGPYGYIRSVKNRQGIGWTFAYTGAPNVGMHLDTVTHTSGRQVSFTWADDQLTGITDPDGKHHTYTYDRGLLGSVTQPGSPDTLITYAYENPNFPGALTGVSYAGVRYSTFAYDTQGRAVRSEHMGPAGTVDVNQFEYAGTSAPPTNPPPFPPAPGGICDSNTHLCPAQVLFPDPDEDAEAFAQRQQATEAALAILTQPLNLSEVTQTILPP